jgi:hypothetical protein
MKSLKVQCNRDNGLFNNRKEILSLYYINMSMTPSNKTPNPINTWHLKCFEKLSSELHIMNFYVYIYIYIYISGWQTSDL